MRIAVVGTGISGLAAAWLLTDAGHEVEVFEARDRLGGHTHTWQVPRPGRDPLPVDTGFIVYNEPTYHNLTALFDRLDVATTPSDMSWSLRCEHHDLEYAGNLRGLAAQPRRLASPRYLRFVADIARFNALGRRIAADPRTTHITLDEFLAAAHLSDDFGQHYLKPMAAAIWSSGTGPVGRFPLQTLVQFFDNHGLLGVTSHHPWRTVVGGSSSYLPKLTAPYADRIHLSSPVEQVTRDRAGVDVVAAGRTHRFDKVVLASHADQSLAMLTDPSPREKELLGAWSYSTSDTWLHTDTSQLPNSTHAWASWNYQLDDCRSPQPDVALSYWMNRLQPLEEYGADRDYVVTLNPTTPPAPDTVVTRMSYRHPEYTPDSVASQSGLLELSGTDHTFYAGAYTRYGFHEDGMLSAVKVASHFGISFP